MRTILTFVFAIVSLGLRARAGDEPLHHPFYAHFKSITTVRALDQKK